MRQISKREIEEKVGRSGRKQIDTIAADRDVEYVVLLESIDLSRYKMMAVGPHFEIDSLEAAEDFAIADGWNVYGFLSTAAHEASSKASVRNTSLFSSKSKQQEIEALTFENTSLKKQLMAHKARERDLTARLDAIQAQLAAVADDAAFIQHEKTRLEQFKAHLEEQETHLQYMEETMVEKTEIHTMREAELDQREDDLAARERMLLTTERLDAKLSEN